MMPNQPQSKSYLVFLTEEYIFLKDFVRPEISISELLISRGLFSSLMQARVHPSSILCNQIIGLYALMPLALLKKSLNFYFTNLQKLTTNTVKGFLIDSKKSRYKI